jgi:hypothetical protein
MKTKILILTVFFACSVSFLFAGSPRTFVIKTTSITIKLSNYEDYSWLAPETPKEATFEDPEPRPAPDITRLAPITPKEATFDESDTDPSSSGTLLTLQNIKPVTPEEADFEEVKEADDPGSPESWNPGFFATSSLK